MSRLKNILSAVFIFSFLGSQAQDTQWANKVLEFSSQLSSAEYAANQILGKPDVLPGGGNNLEKSTKNLELLLQDIRLNPKRPNL